MLDHITLSVADIGRSRDFYDATLEPLGYRRLSDFTEHGMTAAGYGPAFPIMNLFLVSTGAAVTPMPGFHIAFRAESRAAVDGFHAAALAAGGRDNGKPGLRPYHPAYYAAFIIDPDGHHIEAVCHQEPEVLPA